MNDRTAELILQAKSEEAVRIATRLYEIDQDIHFLFRYLGDREADTSEPIKFLEVNWTTTSHGILPIFFRADPESGKHFAQTIICIAPDEYAQLRAGELTLPSRWRNPVWITREGECVEPDSSELHEEDQRGAPMRVDEVMAVVRRLRDELVAQKRQSDEEICAAEEAGVHLIKDHNPPLEILRRAFGLGEK